MGSFNVACSVSGLSINSGERVMFLPLVPNGDLTPTSMLIYSNCLFNPLCLPIEGNYNDYGSLEDIKRDKNIEIIEKIYGLSIDEFMDYVTYNYHDDEPEKLQQISGMFILKTVYDELIKYEIEENSILKSYVTEDELIKLGFKEVPNEEQFFIDPHESKLYRKDSFPFDLKFGEYGCTLIHQKYKEYYVYGDRRYTKEIKRDWEKITKTKIEDTFPEIEDINNVKDKEFKNLQKVFKDLTGCNLGWVKTEDMVYRDVYDLERLLKYWKAETGETLDISVIEEISSYHNYYNKYKKEAEDIIGIYNDEDKFIRKLAIRNLFQDDNFNGKIAEAYMPYVFDDSIKNDLINYRAFYSAMFSCNRFLFPAMNGEQCGNSKASKKLLDISTKIIDSRLKEEEEDEYEDN